MPRSPLVSAATRELAQYFAATTDAAFIDRTWKINSVAGDPNVRVRQVSGDPLTRATAYGDVYRASVEYESGTPIADVIANFINGAIGIGDFQRAVEWPLRDGYEKQLRMYLMRPDDSDPASPKNSIELLGDSERFSPVPTKGQVRLYAAEVYNPFLGPMTKDMGSVEIFMNAIPTLELSRCVPYLNVELITLNRTAGTVAPPLTTLGFLNPSKLSSVDESMIAAQATTVRSEVQALGAGLRSGMELFTSPQTLVNMGEIGPEFVPTIDRLRPLASLGNLSLSTKVQGGTLLFMTGRLEITIHDRSRLREMAAFVRPDLYGTTFLDITYGWSHPDGGPTSRNSYGKFLDALKSTTRFRIAGSTYNFEEGGQIKVTMNIQTVGTTDLLYIGPTVEGNVLQRMQEVIRTLNAELASLRSRPSVPSMAEYDFLSAFQDPASAMAASLNKDILKKLKSLIKNLKGGPLRDALIQLVGSDLTATAPGASSAIGELQGKLVQAYGEIIDKIPSYDQDKFGDAMRDAGDNRFTSMFDNTLYTTVEGKGSQALTDSTGNRIASGVAIIPSGSNKLKTDTLDASDFISYGSAFMNLVAEPIARSGQYDEVQVIFYSFNKRAGAVHDLPISSFPMERARFKKAMEDLAKRTPNVSARQVIGMMYDRFTYFAPARPYLMAGFYNPAKAEDGTAERLDPKQIYKIGGQSYAASPEQTHEERLRRVGIPEARFTMPRVQVYVEGSPMVDYNGQSIPDENGNPKSIIKIHVFDEAMDPHSTITDLISAAKDNEVGVVTLPIAKYNADRRVMDPSAEVAAAAKAALDAGVAAKILTAISLEDQSPVNVDSRNAWDETTSGNVYYQVKGGYDEIKRLVTAAVPTITYGSSTSAMTNASLSSNTSAGLGNVQLLRAFTEPGEVRAEQLNTGVPMLVVPAQLSISTIGCPLFSPMQRFFIDFGTGTSIDNLYYVISFDTSIGKDGFKTEAKMKFGDGFASYRSLNQNLALLAANAKGAISESANATLGVSVPFGIAQPDVVLVDPVAIIAKAKREIRTGLVNAALPLAQIEADQKARLLRELQEQQSRIMAKVEAEKQEALDKLAALVPEDVKAAAIKAKEEADAEIAVAKENAEPVIRAAILAKNLTDVIALANTMPAAVGAAVLSEAFAAVNEAREIAAENAKSE